MTAAAPPLLFSWTRQRGRVRVLLFFFGASILVHAICFYLFQVVYPPTVALLPPPARINVIAPDNKEAQGLLRWIEAEDPALATTTQRAPEAKAATLPRLEHVPSFAAHQPQLKTLPEPTPDLRVPSASAVSPLLPHPTAPVPPAVQQKTAVVFADHPPGLGPLIAPDIHFQSSRAETPGNARFRVALDGKGEVRFCFMAETSGDPLLDEQARQFLMLCRFRIDAPAATNGLTWTTATVLWGNDVTPADGSSPAAP